MADKNKPDRFDVLGETLEPELENMVTSIVDMIARSRSVSRMLTTMSPLLAQTLGRFGPTAVAFAASQIPLTTFGPAGITELAKRLIIESAKHFGNILKKGEVTDKTQAATEAVKQAIESELVLDALGHVHLPECIRLTQLKPFQKQGIRLAQAISQNVSAAPCCFEAIDAKLKKPADEAQKPAKQGNLSAFDILGVMDTAELKKFNQWLRKLGTEERRRVVECLHELDSRDEFTGFMAMDPQIRLEMLPLLENRNAKYALKDYLAAVGNAFRFGFDKGVEALKKVWSKYQDFNGSLQPQVDEQWERFKKPRPKSPWWKMFLPV